MPKIMYRPNPTPPPFVPPVPPVPTGPYMTISPFPFDSNTPVTSKIFNVEVPAESSSMLLQVFDGADMIFEADEMIVQPHIGVITIPAVSILQSTNNMLGTIAFRDEYGEGPEYDLVVYQP